MKESSIHFMSTTIRYPDLAGKVAVVTGGSRGIGAATAQALAHNGVSVAVVGRDQVAVDAVADGIILQGGRAIGIAADCTQEADVERLQDTVANELGSADLLAVFAGGNGMPIPSAKETPSHWREVLETNLTSAFMTISAFLPGMLGQKSGVIITMSSAAARQAAQSSLVYAAAKGGIVALSRHLALELAKDGIRVNCIAPSAIETDRMRSWVSEEQREALGQAFPLGRVGQPGDIAAAALVLASSASSWITGVTLDIAGGKVML